MIVITAPESYSTERNYAVSIILKEFLGLDYQVNFSPVAKQWEMSFSPHERKLFLPDIFFNVSSDRWLGFESMPDQPLKQWLAGSHLNGINLVDPTVPLIYGDDPNTPDFCLISGKKVRIGIDIFGSVFFMLTRYEELVKPDKDQHDRFPATASLAFQEGFLCRPVVDEYIEILWYCMKRLWPGLERKIRVGKVVPTCDVDAPYDPSAASLKTMMKRLGGDLAKRLSSRSAIGRIRNAMAVRNGNFDHDPFYSFDWYLDMCEDCSRKASFYFIADYSGRRMPANYDLGKPWFRKLARSVAERGHEIGMHGSYDTFRNVELMDSERCHLIAACRRAGVRVEVEGNRQHYLRWDSAVTPGVLGNAGFAYDTSGSYADCPGFRYGTARPFPMWDWQKNCQLSLRERPLIMMECSFFSEDYLGCGYTSETLARMIDLKRKSLRFGGDFIFLWHNNRFMNVEDKEYFQALLDNI